MHLRHCVTQETCIARNLGVMKTARSDVFNCSSMINSRVAEVAREHGWHPPKSLDSDENFKPDHTLFCRKLRFVAIYALFFGDIWA